MQNNENDYISLIKTLIQQEEKEAFCVFHEFDFKSRLELRLQAEAPKETAILPLLRKFAPVLGICLLVIIIGIVVFVNFLHYSPYKNNLKSIQKFLQQTTNWQKFEENKAEDRIISTKNNNYVEFEWTIKRVLFSIYKDSLSEKNLHALINQFFSNLATEKVEKLSPESGKKPHRFNLDKKITALKEKKVIYYFLLKFLNKNERR